MVGMSEAPGTRLVLVTPSARSRPARTWGSAPSTELTATDTWPDVTAMIEQGCLRCLSRRPDAKEVDILTRLYREQLDYFSQYAAEAEELLKIGMMVQLFQSVPIRRYRRLCLMRQL